MCKLLILNTTMMWLLCSSLTTVHTCMVRSLPIHGMLTEGSRTPESRWTGRSRIEYTIQLWLSLGTGRGVVQSILGFRELNNRENGVPYRWRSLNDRVSQVPTYQTDPRAKLVSERADGAWYSTTALPSGRDRSQSQCVLRRCGSETETRWTGEWRLSS